MRLSDSPVAAYFDMVEARQGRPVPPILLLALTAVVALAPAGASLPVLLLEGLSCPHGPNLAIMGRTVAWSLGAGAFFALLGVCGLVPMLQAFAYARSFRSLQQGRALEELSVTQASPASLLDAFAWHGLRRTLSCLWQPVLLTLGLLAVAGGEMPGPGPALLLLALGGLWFYGFLAWAAWSRRGSWIFSATLSALMALPVLAVIGLSWVAAWEWGPLTGAGVALGLTLPLAAMQRAWALAGLSARPAARRGARTGVYSDSTGNALLYRERAARAGVLRAHRTGLAGLGMVALWHLWFPDQPAWLPLLAVTAVATVQALFSTASSLFVERQQGTLEMLQQSRLTVREYVAGQVRAASERGIGDVALTALGALAVALPGGEWGSGLGLALMAAAGVTAVDSAAAWGTMAAADCRARLQPFFVALTYGTAAVVGVGLSGMFFTFAGVVLMVVAGPLMAGVGIMVTLPVGLLGVGLVARASAANTLLQRPGSPGFLSQAETSRWTSARVDGL